MVVLHQPWQGHPKDEILGPAEQINMHTRHSRRLFGIDEAADIGLERTRQNSQALWRNTLAIRPEGKPGVQAHEARNGLGGVAKVANFTTDLKQTGGTPVPLQAPAMPDFRAEKKERERLSRLANDALVDISD